MIVPKGYLFAAGEAGLRTHGSGPDVGLAYSTVPAKAAAMFTTNRVKAAPVLLSQEHLRKSRGSAQAIVVNAGNANCATGEHGKRAAKTTVAAVARLLDIPAHNVLIASTGVIGVKLEAERITGQLPALARRMHPEGVEDFSRSILTTDTRPKVSSESLVIGGKKISILGIAKGAGMIYPRLATMLGFFFTDAAVEGKYLQATIREMCEVSFNRVSVDGDTSTNDTVFLLANGMAGNRALTKSSAGAKPLLAALTAVAQELAIALVKDGEGAQKLAEIRVEGMASAKKAEAVARSIALSSLVKTAIAGADPNWGRILAAAGNAGAEFDPNKVNIYLNRMLVCRNGGAAEFDEAAGQRELSGKEILIRVVFREGKAQARFWTCDFTEEYIRVNASYRT